MAPLTGRIGQARIRLDSRPTHNEIPFKVKEEALCNVYAVAA
jgi:hypothetical protein